MKSFEAVFTVLISMLSLCEDEEGEIVSDWELLVAFFSAIHVLKK